MGRQICLVKICANKPFKNHPLIMAERFLAHLASGLLLSIFDKSSVLFDENFGSNLLELKMVAHQSSTSLSLSLSSSSSDVLLSETKFKKSFKKLFPKIITILELIENCFETKIKEQPLSNRKSNKILKAGSFRFCDPCYRTPT